MKKYSLVMAIFLAIILIASSVFATTTTNFEVVSEDVCTIKLNDYCSFEKSLVSKDISNKNVTLQLKITNTSDSLKPTGEVVIVLDNSGSMLQEVYSGTTRKDLIANSANNLIDNLLNDNEKLKVGLVSFSSHEIITSEGSLADAKLVSNLTNDTSTLKTSISSLEMTGYRTDLEAGITLGKTLFSSEQNNKYMIVLTDGIPNLAINYDGSYYSDDVIAKSKTSLQSVTSSNISLITMLSGIADGTEPILRPTGQTAMTTDEYINAVFGTSTNPTSGKFYYVQDTDIESTIKTNIYNDLLPISQDISFISIVDFFPQQIVNNFDFSYVSSSNLGKVTTSIDKSTNSIVWSIEKLASGETGVIQYKLALKDNFSTTILNKILPTNEKVDISFNDFNGTEQLKTSDVSPKVRVTQTVKDTTKAPTILPNTGSVTFAILLSIACAYSIISLIKYVKINRTLK